MSTMWCSACTTVNSAVGVDDIAKYIKLGKLGEAFSSLT